MPPLVLGAALQVKHCEDLTRTRENKMCQIFDVNKVQFKYLTYSFLVKLLPNLDGMAYVAIIKKQSIMSQISSDPVMFQE